LPDLDGVTRELSDLRGRIAVLVFWSCECAHIERFESSLEQLPLTWKDDVVIWRVASAANESLEQLRHKADALGVGPILLDRDQAVADAFGAEVTPHVVALDRQGVIGYLGAPDDVTLRQRQPTRSYLAEAVAALLSGTAPNPSQVPAFGCVLTRRRLPFG
jgi:hypothetical protein